LRTTIGFLAKNGRGPTCDEIQFWFDVQNSKRRVGSKSALRRSVKSVLPIVEKITTTESHHPRLIRTEDVSIAKKGD
jgi:hypothetical protein